MSHLFEHFLQSAIDWLFRRRSPALMDMVLGETGPVEPLLGPEQFEVFSFPQSVSGLARLTSGEILEPNDPAVQDFVRTVKQAAGRAPTRREVVTMPRR